MNQNLVFYILIPNFRSKEAEFFDNLKECIKKPYDPLYKFVGNLIHKVTLIRH